MPVVLRLEGARFFFYSNEGRPPEPPHIHVRRAGAEAKFWLGPPVQLAQNDGFEAATLRRLTKVVEAHRQELEAAWHEYFA
ncbi:DUF4160 domain-containing protein [Rhodospira trueperi]|uniref:DUF4160 domain-containing protein n=1 Tax=Rhodospira trueperi TaxID=69960 RepID=A0A1G7FKY7_9PROT|nr:DUF4160 domain-containing protein [Rhodospira trueperi]SDE76295.1 protein of unknown function [Rhodospira trueperi]